MGRKPRASLGITLDWASDVLFHKKISRKGLRGTVVPDILNESPNGSVSGEAVEGERKKIVKCLLQSSEV